MHLSYRKKEKKKESCYNLNVLYVYIINFIYLTEWLTHDVFIDFLESSNASRFFLWLY